MPHVVTIYLPDEFDAFMRRMAVEAKMRDAMTTPIDAEARAGFICGQLLALLDDYDEQTLAREFEALNKGNES